MSANVWFEEVDRGLLAEIRNSVKYLDADGTVVPIREDMVTVRDPESEFTDEVFPCITCTNISDMFNPMRYHFGDVKVDEVVETNQAIMEKTAVPYDLTYQIDFWARYREDINLMTRTWLVNHARQFNLPVVDDGGNERTCNVLVKEGLKESNLLSGQKRLYHSIVSYTIWVELDDEVRYNTNMVTDRTYDISKEEGE